MATLFGVSYEREVWASVSSEGLEVSGMIRCGGEELLDATVEEGDALDW